MSGGLKSWKTALNATMGKAQSFQLQIQCLHGPVCTLLLLVQLVGRVLPCIFQDLHDLLVVALPGIAFCSLEEGHVVSPVGSMWPTSGHHMLSCPVNLASC